jgi:hypothetical protein
MAAFPANFQLMGQSSNWGPVELRLRDPQASPFQVTAMDVEEDGNNIGDQLELPPYFTQGSGVATLNAYIELEIQQQQLLLHSESPVPFVGSVHLLSHGRFIRPGCTADRNGATASTPGGSPIAGSVGVASGRVLAARLGRPYGLAAEGAH